MKKQTQTRSWCSGTQGTVLWSKLKENQVHPRPRDFIKDNRQQPAARSETKSSWTKHEIYRKIAISRLNEQNKDSTYSGISTGRTGNSLKNLHISLLILFDTPHMEFLFDLPVPTRFRRHSPTWTDDSPHTCSHQLLAKCLQQTTKSPVQVRRMKENSFLISKYSAVNR